MLGNLFRGIGILLWGMTKTVITLVVLTGLFAAFYFFRPITPMPPAEGSLLEIRLVGRVSDMPPVTDGVSSLLHEAQPVTVLGDVVDALHYAADDKRLAGVLLRVDELESLGGASARVIGEAIDDYRKTSGKNVWCYGYAFTQAQYAVASHADRLWMHPMGQVEIKGFTGETLYWGDLLRRFGIGTEVYKAGDFKSAPEVFERSSPSDENLEAQRTYLSDMWRTMVRSLEAGRGLQEDGIRRYIDALAAGKTMSDGAAQFQKAFGLVDEVGDRAAFREAMKSAFVKQEALPRTDFYDYLDYRDAQASTGDGVAVLYAEGEIMDNPQFGGIVADETVMRITQASADPSVRALVLRINSPGGDAVAAEKIRAALVSVREKGKPVIVSMGDMAASGGYWVATGADAIVADPMTLTGSIGVFAVLPKLEALRETWQVGYGGHATEPALSDGSLWRTTGAAQRHLMALSVEYVYKTFKGHVSEARKLAPEAVEAVAEGRVWTGAQALERGLVDQLGTLDNAVREAQKRAQLPDDAPVYHWYPAPGAWWRAILSGLPLAWSKLLPAVETAEQLLTRDAGRVMARSAASSSL